MKPIIRELMLACGCFLVAGVFSRLAPTEYDIVMLMISVITLGIGCSFIPSVRKIDLTFQAGQFIILIYRMFRDP